MKSIDKFFSRKYSATDYNCAHFVSEVWEYLTGRNIRACLNGFLLPPQDINARMVIRQYFKRLDAPCSPCIVLMQRPKIAAHVGLFLRGKVLHIQDGRVEYQPIDVVVKGYKSHRYYDVEENCIS